MNVIVDPDDPVPVYEQIRRQVVRMVLSGVLPQGTRLPTIRQLAADLGVAKGTVERAYELLAVEAVVERRGRNGTVVSAPRPGAAGPAGQRGRALDEAVQRAADDAVLAARQLGVDRLALLAAVDDAWRRLEPSDGPDR